MVSEEQGVDNWVMEITQGDDNKYVVTMDSITIHRMYEPVYNIC